MYVLMQYAGAKQSTLRYIIGEHFHCGHLGKYDFTIYIVWNVMMLPLNWFRFFCSVSCEVGGANCVSSVFHIHM